MNADIRIENGKLVYGLEECFCRPDGTMSGSKPCRKCKGTRRTKGGKGKGQCTACLSGTEVDHEQRVPCLYGCNGTHFKQSTSCSYLPDSIFPSLNFVVYRSERPQTLREKLLGMGVYSCTDYGDHKRMTDDELIAKVKTHTSVQATKISDKDGNVAHHIGIFCNNHGYTVGPVFE
jgi:hypothetical protein